VTIVSGVRADATGMACTDDVEYKAKTTATLTDLIMIFLRHQHLPIEPSGGSRPVHPGNHGKSGVEIPGLTDRKSRIRPINQARGRA
jgi:hypothetical protein